jgi:hypothetical protein
MTASLTLRSHSAISERRSSRNQFVQLVGNSIDGSDLNMHANRMNCIGKIVRIASLRVRPLSVEALMSNNATERAVCGIAVGRKSEACLARQNYPCHRRWLRDGRDDAAIRQVENWWCGDAALNLSARSSLDRARHLNRRSRSMSDAASAALALSLNPPTRRQYPRASTAVNSAMPCARLANRQMPRIIGASK